MEDNLIKKGLSILGYDDKYARFIGIKNKYEEAIELFLKAKRINPKNYLVWWILGHTYKNNNQNDKALDCFLKVMELGITYDYHNNDYHDYEHYYLSYDNYFESQGIGKPTYESIWYNLGHTYFINGKYKEAIDCYLKYKEIDASASYGIDEHIGDAYCKMGKYKEAIDYFLTCEAMDGGRMIKLANAYYSNGQFNEAVATLLKSTETEPCSYYPTIYNSLGCLYLINGDYEKAIDSFLKAPNYIIWMALEDAYKIEGFYKKSIDYLAKILETGNTEIETDILSLLGISFYKFGNYDGAIHSFLDYTELYHNDYIIWSLLGISYIFNKQYEEALEPLLTATELGPSSYFSWYYLGFLYYKSKKYNEAIKTLWKAAKLNIFYFERDDNRYILFYTTNNIYYKNGEYKDTTEFFLKSIGISSNGYELWVMLGNSYYEIGQYDKAKKSYLKANKLNPEDKVSLEMIEKLKPILKNKEKEEAEKIEDNIIFKRASKNHPYI